MEARGRTVQRDELLTMLYRLPQSPIVHFSRFDVLTPRQRSKRGEIDLLTTQSSRCFAALVILHHDGLHRLGNDLQCLRKGQRFREGNPSDRADTLLFLHRLDSFATRNLPILAPYWQLFSPSFISDLE